MLAPLRKVKIHFSELSISPRRNCQPPFVGKLLAPPLNQGPSENPCTTIESRICMDKCNLQNWRNRSSHQISTVNSYSFEHEEALSHISGLLSFTCYVCFINTSTCHNTCVCNKTLLHLHKSINLLQKAVIFEKKHTYR